jgi:DNA-binding MarR family transcriptional regulator
MADNGFYDVWLALLEQPSHARFRRLLLDRAGVTLDAELARCLVNVDLRGPIGVLELAQRLEQNHPKASRSLDRLERLGLVTRATAPRDRRIKTAAATPKGHRLVEAIHLGRRRLLDEVFADWSEHDRAELARLARRFTDDVSRLVDAQLPNTGDDGA